MNKLKMFLIISLVCTLLSGCIRIMVSDSEASNNQPEPTAQPLNHNVLIYDDEYLTLTYKYAHDNGVYFSVLNKTSDYFSISANYFIFDGVTFPQNYYSRQVAPNYEDTYVYECELDNKDIKTISGNMYIYGPDGFTIEEFEFKDISIE